MKRTIGSTIPVAVALVGAALVTSGCARLRAWRAAEPVEGDGVYELTLAGALAGGTGGALEDLQVYVERRGGKWRQAFAQAPTWNQAYHKVDPGGLLLAGKAVKGNLKVTLQPDQWVPGDGAPVACTFTLDAQLADAKVAGRHKGTCGKKEVEGTVSGKVTPRDPSLYESCHVSLKLENLLAFGEDWKRRVELVFRRRDGASLIGTASVRLDPQTSDVTDLKVDTTTLALGPDAMTGKFVFLVPTNKQAYAVSVRGIVVGRHVGGTFEGMADGTDVGPGVFTGALDPVKDEVK